MRHRTPPPPKVVTLDLDDTLWPIEEVVAHAERRLHDWFAVRFPRVAARYQPTDLRRLRNEMEALHPELAGDMGALRHRSLEVALESVGDDADAAPEAFGVFWAARHELALFDDVIPALHALHERGVLGAITNGNADLTLLGLAHHFDFVLAAASFGHAKPAPEIFHAACIRTGAEPHEVLHAGDDPELDVCGALDAGLRAAWVNRHGAAWPRPDRRPPLVVRDLGELARALR